MRFRARLLVTLFGTVVLPCLVLSWLVRDNMTNRLQQQYLERIDALVAVVDSRLQEYALEISDRLEILGAVIQNDNGLRASLTHFDGDPRSIDLNLIDFGEASARLSGLTFLQIQTREGLILTSGHFRSESGRTEPHADKFRQVLKKAKGYPGVVTGRAPEGPVLALGRVDSFLVGNSRYYIVGGYLVNSDFLRSLVPAPEFDVCLAGQGAAILSTGSIFNSCVLPDRAPNAIDSLDAIKPTPESARMIEYRAIEIPLANTDTGVVGSTDVLVSYSQTDLMRLLADLDKWFIGILGIVIGFGLLSIIWVSGKISEPLSELVDKTARIDLNRLNVSFKSGRTDEVGDLSRVMDEMLGRLRRSSAALRNIERRLAIGELARQVNHDIKNGLAPIRNIIRHYSSVAREEPSELSRIIREREASLDASIDYLEELAAKYASLSPQLARTTLDLNELVAEIVEDYGSSRRLKIETAFGAAFMIETDPIAIRRILENLLDNAFDSLSKDSGKVVVRTTTTSQQSDVDPYEALITITDSGSGMEPSDVENAFKDFHTTKAQGTGLGLSIVRRLMMDLNGSIKIDSTPGRGTTVTLRFPTRVPGS